MNSRMPSNSEPRLYLDNAATSWPKPESVYAAVDQYQRRSGVAAGRGSYAEAISVERSIEQCRDRLCSFVGGRGVGHVVFGFNCTDVLNLVLHGVLRSGDHVVTSAAEHNSVLRPLAELTRRLDIDVSMVATDSLGEVHPEDVEQEITPRTRLVAMTHASNVTGCVQPINAVGQLTRDRGLLFLVDAAQTIGHLPINVVQDHIDFLCAPGHKGLLGPLGTGLAFIAEAAASDLATLRQGGTGTRSDEAAQPEEAPSKFESGNLNVPGLLGLDAGVRFLQEQELTESRLLTELTTETIEHLSKMQRVTIYSQPNACGIVSFNIAGYDPRELAAMLDSTRGIQVRAGFHCAPRMHQTLGTLDGGGTVRVSFGHFNSTQHVEELVQMVRMFATDAL